MGKSLTTRLGKMRLNLVSASLGYMGYGAAQFCVLIVVARLASPAAVGQFSLAFAIAAPVFLALDLQLRRIVASDTKCLFRPWTMLSVRIASCALAIAAIAILSAFVSDSSEQCELNIVVALAKSFESISDLLYGYFQRIERMHSIAISLWLKGIGALAAFSIVLSKTHSILNATGALACAWLLLLLCFDVPRVWRIWRTTEVPAIVSGAPAWLLLIQMAGPLGIALVFTSVSQNLPRYIVEIRLGRVELGIYAAASYFFVVGGRLAMAVADTILPRLSKLAEADFDAFNNTILKAVIPLIGFCLGLTVAAAWLAKPLLTLVYGQAYAAGAPTVVIVLIAACMHCVGCVFQSALIALRQANVQMGISAAGTLTTLVAAVALVGWLGSAGAAIGLTAGLGVQAAASGLVTFAVVRRLRAAAHKSEKSNPIFGPSSDATAWG